MLAARPHDDLTGTDLPSEIDEIEFAGLTSTPSQQVEPVRIAEAPTVAGDAAVAAETIRAAGYEPQPLAH